MLEERRNEGLGWKNPNSWRNVSGIMEIQKHPAKLDSTFIHVELEHDWKNSWCSEILRKGRDKQNDSHIAVLTVVLGELGG